MTAQASVDQSAALPQLSAMDVAARSERLRLGMAGASLDALLVTSMTNIAYLSGFTGSAGMLVVSANDTVLVTDGRYATQSVAELTAHGVDARVEVVAAADQRRLVAAELEVLGVSRLGVEAAHVSWAAAKAYAADWFPSLELVATVGLVEELRAIKDAGELSRMARAGAIADAALASSMALLADGPTESEFGRALDEAMRFLGAGGPAFDTIVASGPNAARPHHRPSSRPIGHRDVVVVDFGATVEGYRSDMTRTLWMEEPGDHDLRRALDVVARSQAAGVEEVGPGVRCSEVDATCREIIALSGFGEQFVHGTGHGVGLDIHEAPAVSANSTGTLVAGHVVTVEPGVYLPGVGGVRVEDTLVVTDVGCYPLTRAPKALVGT